MRGPWPRASGAVAAAALATTGALHAVWVFSAWPFSSESEGGLYLVGDPEVWAPPLPTAAVAGALFAGAYLALAASRLVPRPGPGWIYRLGNSGLIAVMVARGAGGWVFNAGAAQEFVTWNTRLYSPLCLAIALLVTLAWLGDRDRDRVRDHSQEALR
ncbi:DUF3995 domain-containing protein [Spirillospora sp. CA-294931]|uniref:DUF3995 domain-containing protein n=1 Tax=Spirillospora sp. CA-294931 TaxID=3240042 RepID=UPI003D908CA0